MVQHQFFFRIPLHLAEINFLLTILEAQKKKKGFIFAPCAAEDLLPSLPTSLMMLKAISLTHASSRLFLQVRLLGQFGIYRSALSETASTFPERDLPCWCHVPLEDLSSLSTRYEIRLFYLVLGIF